MKQQPRPEDRLMDDLLSSQERSDFFADVEAGITDRMKPSTGTPKSGLGWGGITVVIILLSGIAMWTIMMLVPDDVVVVKPDAPHDDVLVESTGPQASASSSTTEPDGAPILPVSPASKDIHAPVVTSSETQQESPSNLQATASSTSSIAERARREADSLRTVLSTTTDVTRRLSLQYDIGVRLRMAGSAEESMKMLTDVGARSQQLGASMLSARSMQQAAVAAHDLGRTSQAIGLLEQAVERHPDRSSTQYKRWQQQLQDWKR